MAPAVPSAPAAQDAGDDGYLLGGRRFRSRLIIGSGKYRSDDEMRIAHEATGAEIITVALRRVVFQIDSTVADRDQLLAVELT